MKVIKTALAAALALALAAWALALAACSQGGAAGTTVTVGSGSAAVTATQLALPDAMALMRADYVGADAYNRGVAYGFGKDGNRTVALFVCRTEQEYRSWFGDYDKSGDDTDNTVTITDDVTGDVVQLTITGTTKNPTVYSDVLDNPGSLTTINYGSADAARNFLKATDEDLVDFDVAYTPQG